jgi:membrane dipeptidase
MTDPTTPPIFDGHNDVLLRLYNKQASDAATQFVEGDGVGHLDLPRMKTGGFAGGFFAVFIPSPKSESIGGLADAMQGETYELPLPPEVDITRAQPIGLEMMGLLFQIERESDGDFVVCRTAAEIRDTIGRGAVAAVLHIEGAEMIDAEFRSLELLYQAGLRSIGPVWSRPTAFAHGVPFKFPGSPDTGPGLTDLGRELVTRCNDMGVMLDLSHINEAGFWDVADRSDAPLVATHSNAFALCESTRNLTDKQLAAIRESGGMVGVNFATCFLRPDGQMNAQTGLDVMMRHLDHLIEHVGEDGVGFGSDFDGAMIPGAIGDVAGLPTLRQAMRDHGVDDALMEKLAWKNWARVLEATWGA